MRPWMMLLSLLGACAPPPPNPVWPVSLRTTLSEQLAGEPATVALVLTDIASGDSILLQPDRRFHAASTMKLAVLLELARRVDAGALSWEGTLTVRNRFASMVDGSPYTLSPADDSDSTLYHLEGRAVPLRRLAELMIARSSNLATNLLIEQLGPARVQQTARALGADSMEIRRGVEDSKAFARGLNNTTTARDLARLLGAMASGRAAGPESTGIIRQMLLNQEFNDGIPAGLPSGTLVAHKTGEITGIAHDAAIIYPDGGRPYVLVVLTEGYRDRTEASRLMAVLSQMVWESRAKRRSE